MSPAPAFNPDDAARAAALKAHLARRIAHEGPLPIDRYMADALAHPQFGYYAQGRPIGSAGDFTTAPEISQMFGELIGLWLATVWTEMGKPPAVDLVELGPGRGVLMADLLRAAGGLAAFRDALRVHLVELDGPLRDEQRARLTGEDPIWLDRLADLPLDPDRPLLLVANEFFDAMPVKQFERRDGVWRERTLDWADGALKGVLSAQTVAPALIPDDCARSPTDGAILEVCPSGLSLAREIGERLAVSGGAALLIDYGYAPGRGFPRPPQGTLMGIRRHLPADPFTAPGLADLSAHVDFDALARAAREGGAKTHGPITQRAFLKACGIDARAAKLKEGALPAPKAAVTAAHARLTDAEDMGGLFKILAVTGGPAPAPVFS